LTKIRGTQIKQNKFVKNTGQTAEDPHIKEPTRGTIAMIGNEGVESIG